jgi:glycosyltransferase involved in cell wall biosynthesis
VGGGEPDDTLWTKAELLGLREQVKLTGMLDPAGVGEQMRNADIQLIPSQAGAEGFVENFCTVASEGLASGLALVASNHGGIPEAVGDAGVLVPGGSALELARGIVHAMQTDTPEGWAAKAAAHAQRYQDEHMMDDFERVTREAIEDAHA